MPTHLAMGNRRVVVRISAAISQTLLARLQHRHLIHRRAIPYCVVKESASDSLPDQKSGPNPFDLRGDALERNCPITTIVIVT